jgi:hypothetical protein
MDMKYKNNQCFMKHPFWTDILAIQGEINVKGHKKEEFLSLVVQGFYPISHFSYFSFNLFANLAGEANAKSTARFIAEVENGAHPLLGNAPYKGIPHCELLNICIASLINKKEGFQIKNPESFQFFTNMKNMKLNEVEALAFCNEIEETAPMVINNYQDFVAKWQYLNKIPSAAIQRVYLDEHNLTEGSDFEDQHIQMIGKMNSPYLEEM